MSPILGEKLNRYNNNTSEHLTSHYKPWQDLRLLSEFCRVLVLSDVFRKTPDTTDFGRYFDLLNTKVYVKSNENK